MKLLKTGAFTNNIPEKQHGQTQTDYTGSDPTAKDSAEPQTKRMKLSLSQTTGINQLIEGPPQTTTVDSSGKIHFRFYLYL